jgi:hypothetical protein
LTDALQKLVHDIDIVLCSMHFDESRMFELRWHIKRAKSRHPIPFVSVDTKNTVLSSSVVLVAAKAVIAMGGDGFIGLCRWRGIR